MKIELSPTERKALKARAHGVDPVVLIGAEGLTPAVLREIERSLKAHELIKIRASTDERENRESWLAEICDRLHAAPVQHIGKMLIIFRENPDKKAPPAPPPKRKGPRLTKAQEQEKAIRRRRSRA